MSKLFRVIIVAVLVTATYFFFKGRNVDPFKQITSEIKAKSSFATRLHPLEQLSNAKAILGHASDEIALEYKDRKKSYSTKELLPKVTGLLSQFERLSTDFSIENVVERGDKTELVVVARGLGQLAGKSDLSLDRHKVEVTLKQFSGEWKVVSGRYLENLRDEEP